MTDYIFSAILLVVLSGILGGVTFGESIERTLLESCKRTGTVIIQKTVVSCHVEEGK